MQRRIVAYLAIGYALCFVVWRLLVASPYYEQWWPLQLSEVFAVWALLPLLPLAAAGLIWPSYQLWLALAAPLLWFAVNYGSLFMPEVTSRAWANSPEPVIRVMTFNTWKQEDQEGELAARLNEWQPDLVAFQEISRDFRRQLEGMAEEWPYQVYVTARGNARLSLLSKWPVMSYDADQAREGCHCAQVVIDWRGQPIRVIVVHIRAPGLGVMNRRGEPLRVRGFDTSEQEVAFAALLRVVEASREPVIVLGDFNTTERQAGYQLLYAKGLANAHEEVGWGVGLTYPAPFSRISWLPFPVIRIDHIFYDRSWEAVQSWRADLMGSDHLALLADLRWVGDQ